MSRLNPASVVLSLPLVLVVLMLIHHQGSEARFTLPSICRKPPPRSEGVCAIDIEGHYFDPADMDCKLYQIGGCHVVPGQSFGSMQDCVSTCIHGFRRSHDFYLNE
ncbi:kunitz-type serine protease inhibitor vestiginin-5 [Drosophila ficusphila]|uniref:kunitz-type serine protease inhibitor vestiginin-5 n=1 Tax=Drosophila ficusphila TaxID=30025 RepID=UPI0007E85688|nr:kunitz-type serine protease inhibitor vestiginin-5 [Drosophila ficusphila]